MSAQRQLAIQFAETIVKKPAVFCTATTIRQRSHVCRIDVNENGSGSGEARSIVHCVPLQHN